MKRSFAIILALTAVASVPAQAKKCPAADPVAIADRMTTMYRAVQANDGPALDGILAPDFYAFDVGKRYDGAQLMGLLKTALASGRKYEWNVTQPQVHFACDTAWITYVNQGAVGDATMMHPQTWLESAILHHDGKAWRVQFLHATRVTN